MTSHFTTAELRCKCGCGLLPVQAFMDRIEALRVAFDKPMATSMALAGAESMPTGSSAKAAGNTCMSR